MNCTKSRKGVGTIRGQSQSAISWCQDLESGMSADIDRGSNPRSVGVLAGAWKRRLRPGDALSRGGRVTERRGDGVKHSTTSDDQGVTALPAFTVCVPLRFPTAVGQYISRAGGLGFLSFSLSFLARKGKRARPRKILRACPRARVSTVPVYARE